MYRLVTRHRGHERVHAAPPAAGYRQALALVQRVVRQQQAAGDPPVRVLLQRRYPRANGHVAHRTPGPAPLDRHASAADSGVWLTVESWDEAVVARILHQWPVPAAGPPTAPASPLEGDGSAATAAGTPAAEPPRIPAATDRTEASGAAAVVPPVDTVGAVPAGAASRLPTASITDSSPLPRAAPRYRRSRWSLLATLAVLLLAWFALAALLAGWPGCGWLPVWVAPPAATQPTLPFDGPLLDAARR